MRPTCKVIAFTQTTIMEMGQPPSVQADEPAMWVRMQHHPIRLHGHTFCITGYEAARCPKSAWVPRNTELIGIAQATDFEFIANNPDDWMSTAIWCIT